MTDSNNQLLQNSNIAPNTEIKNVEIKEENKNIPESEHTDKKEENQKPEESKTEHQKAEEPTIEVPKTEEPKVEQVKITEPNIENQKAEAPKMTDELPKIEEHPKTEIPNVENNQKTEEKPIINEMPKEIEVKKDEVNIEKFEEKKEEPISNVDVINHENINKINNEVSNPMVGGEFNNVLESNEIKDKQIEEQKDNIDIPMSNMEFNNFNNDVMDFNSQILNDKRTPSKNSISNLSSSGIDPRNFLGKKRQYNKFENDELTCKEIYANKNSSPSLIMLSKIVEEFTFGMVLDTLLKSNLSQNLKLDAMLQGLIDSEGINKVILMLLKFNIINIFYIVHSSYFF